jgi:PEP-CTERM motif
MIRRISGATVLCAFSLAIPAQSGPVGFSFTTGAPDGRLGAASRPGTSTEIETADDFILSSQTLINSATFVGLLPAGAPLSSVTGVGVEFYRVFPLDSVSPPDGRVPTRVNSPSDNAFMSFDIAAGNLTVTLLNATFTTANSVLNGINPSPNQTTGGEGSVSGEEVQFAVTFPGSVNLLADHYFFKPQVALSSGNFYWLSTARSAPLFPGDLQAWIRNTNLDPDWLRIGTDIVGGSTPPTYNMAFSLTGTVVPEPSTFLMMFGSVIGAAILRSLRRR